MSALLNTAIKAARKGGDYIMRYAHRTDELKVETKARNEFVTQVDQATEQLIMDSIHEFYPQHAFIGEESGEVGDSDHVWIIDPLDGTTNFLHGFPYFCVSLALHIKGRPEVAVVYDPNRQELFTALRGSGAQVDGRRIRVSNQRHIEGSMLGTGFPYRLSDAEAESYLGMFRDLSAQAAGIRRPGAAALDLCYLAAGRLDGFWEFGLKPWDIAAGALIIREAGGLISSLTPDGDYMETGNVLAANPKLHGELRRLVEPHLAALKLG